MPGRSPRSLAALGALAVFATACAHDVTAPDASPASSAARRSLTATATIRTIPNGVRYRDAGVHPATGRSGGATLATRALLGRDGNTLVELSSGPLDAATHPGNIDKAQIKVRAGNNTTSNYKGLTGGGYFSTSLSGLSSGDSLQVQANISGIDKSNDVVTVTTGVTRRPDIAVRSVSAKPSAAPHEAVVITATVSELNGDLGATGDCVLSVDGAPVETAHGIWVDAGSTVSCRFTHAFDTPGTHSLGVAVTNLTPGDWDTSNNAASTSITIIQPDVAVTTGSLDASELHWDYLLTESNNGIEFHREHWVDSWSKVSMSGEDDDAAATLDQLARLDVTIAGNGVVAHSASLVPDQRWAYDDGSFYARCQTYDQSTWNGTHYVSDGDGAQVCEVGYHAGTHQVSYWYEHQSGWVTYEGSSDTYSWNYDYAYGSTQAYGWSAGTTVGVHLAFVDGTGWSHTVDRTLPLTDHTADRSYVHDRCDNDPYRGGTTCVHEAQTGAVFENSVSW